MFTLKSVSVFASFAFSACVSQANPLKIVTHTAGDAGFDVNSHLIVGSNESILVDAQFTRSEARKVVEMIQSTGTELKAIFVTHGHPDHYFGLEVLKKAFPNAKAIASPETLEDIRSTAQGKLSYWKPMYKDDLTDSIVEPEAFQLQSLSLDGHTIRILRLGEGESAHGNALYIEDSGDLITGDAAYNNVHLWLAEGRPEGWLANLNRLQNLDVSRVYPGHGADGGREILEKDVAYIHDFIQAKTQSPATAFEAISQKYSSYSLPVILKLSLGQ